MNTLTSPPPPPPPYLPELPLKDVNIGVEGRLEDEDGQEHEQDNLGGHMGPGTGKKKSGTRRENR